MKYIKPLAIIFAVSFLGEALRALLPFLPVPASIYGLVAHARRADERGHQAGKC